MSSEYTELEIQMAMEAHQCNREDAISTYAAQIRAYRESQRPQLQMEQLRHMRNQKLSATDWWVLPDRTATDEQLAYRQALRDITDQYTSLGDVVWPTPPE